MMTFRNMLGVAEALEEDAAKQYMFQQVPRRCAQENIQADSSNQPQQKPEQPQQQQEQQEETPDDPRQQQEQPDKANRCSCI